VSKFNGYLVQYLIARRKKPKCFECEVDAWFS